MRRVGGEGEKGSEASTVYPCMKILKMNSNVA